MKELTPEDLEKIKAIQKVLTPYFNAVKDTASVRLSLSEWKEIVLALEFKAKSFGYIEVKDRQACFDLAQKVKQKSDCFRPEGD